MRAVSIFRASQALSSAASHGAELATAELPYAVGRSAARARIVEQLSLAARDAEQAAELLEAGGLGAASIDAAREAATLLRARADQPITVQSARDAGSRLVDVVRAVRGREESAFEIAGHDHARRLLATPPAQLDDAALRDLAALGRDRDVRQAFPGIEALVDVPTSQLRAVALSEPARRGLDRAHVAARFDIDGAGVSMEAKRIVQGDPARVSAAGWRTLESVLALDAASPTLSAPRTIPGAPDLIDVARRAAGGDLDVGAARRYAARWEQHDLPVDEVRSHAAKLLERPSDELDADSLIYLDAALDRSPSIAVTLPGIGDTRLLRQLGHAAAAAAADPGVPLAPLQESWLASRVTFAEPRARATTLMQLNSGELTRDDWADLSMILDGDPDGAIINVARSREGSKALPEIARTLAAGGRHHAEQTQRYFDAWAFTQLSIDGRQDAASALLSKPASSLSRAQWSTIATMLEEDPAGAAIKMVRERAALKPFVQVARDIADGAHPADRPAQRYLDSWAFSQLALEQQQSVATGLVSGPASGLTRPEWLKLAIILEDDVDGSVLAMPRELAGSKPLHQIARNIAFHSYVADVHAQRYFDARAFGQLTLDEQSVAAAALMSKPASSLTVPEWSKLAAILAVDSDAAAIGVVRQLDGLAPFEQIAADIASRKYGPESAKVQRYFDGWALRQTPEHKARVTSAIDSVLSGSGSDEERKLAALRWLDVRTSVESRPVSERARIVELLLEDPDVTSTGSARGALRLLRGVLDDMTISQEMRPIADETRSLVDRNLSRFAWSTPNGATITYGNHPDYAEIGDIRSNAALLFELARDEPRRIATRGQNLVTW